MCQNVNIIVYIWSQKLAAAPNWLYNAVFDIIL